MPFIELKTNQNINAVKEILKSELGSAITAIPGKSEACLWLSLRAVKQCILKEVMSLVQCLRFPFSAKRMTMLMMI